MNIEDRYALYAELRRVLKQGARFAFHDVVASTSPRDAFYPTPWAQSAANSFLLNEDETVAALQRAGLHLEVWEDVTEDAIAAIAAARASSPPGPTLGSIMGARFPEMTLNYARNLSEGRLRVVMGRAVAS
jgi:sarcosine/dimethylglycine N-methyltransferase